jgi:acyl-CoA synthetase (NDP forming)
VALKLDSERITHKSDVGGVKLNIQNEEELLAVYDEMLSNMRALDGDAKLTVQKMQPEGFELILGGVRRSGTGPLVMCGMGGVYSEVMGDTAFRMAPVSEGEPERMLSTLRCAPVLNGFRGKRLDKAAAARNIAILSELMDKLPRIREIDINPCRVYETGAAILDARIVLDDKETHTFTSI